MTEAKETKYMIGTEGGTDYIVIAQHAENLSIGVKPVMAQQNSLQVFVGFRVRCADNRPLSSGLDDVEKVLEEKPTLFKWEKIDDTRASTMYGGLFPIPFKKTAEEIMQSLEEQNYFQNLLDNLSGMFQVTESNEKVLKFIQTPLQNQVVRLADRYEKVEEPENYAKVYNKYTNKE